MNAKLLSVGMDGPACIPIGTLEEHDIIVHCLQPVQGRPFRACNPLARCLLTVGSATILVFGVKIMVTNFLLLPWDHELYRASMFGCFGTVSWGGGVIAGLGSGIPTRCSCDKSHDLQTAERKLSAAHMWETVFFLLDTVRRSRLRRTRWKLLACVGYPVHKWAVQPAFPGYEAHCHSGLRGEAGGEDSPLKFCLRVHEASNAFMGAGVWLVDGLWVIPVAYWEETPWNDVRALTSSHIQ